MKTIKTSIFSLLVTIALVGHAQIITQPGWYRGINVKPSSAGSTAPGGAKAQTLLISGSQPLSLMGLSGSTNIAEAITPEISALARGLENDPTRIFNFVHDHIRHVLYYGSKKGAELTLLERSGNDFDQCALLMALLQAAGYTNVGYQFGMLQMPYDSADHNDLHHWLELSLVNTNAINTSNYFNILLGSRGYPWFPNNNTFYQIDANTFEFQRIWVTLTNSSTVYYLDPAFKISEPIAGIDLAAAAGISSNALMSAAGGTVTADYVKGLTETTLRSKLQTYNSNLLATIQNSYPNASVQQILGGQQIMPWTNALSQAVLFPQDTQSGLFPMLGWQSEPTNFMSTFGVSFGSVSQSWYFPQLQGQRLSLTFSNNGTAQLWLGDSLILQDNITGGSASVTLTANHPYGVWDTDNNIPIDTSWSDAAVPNSYQATNASYALLYAFEPDPAWLQQRQRQLDTYRQQGYSNTSRQVVTETLNLMGLNWLIQTKLNQDNLAAQIGVLPESFERLGRMAQESGHGYYIDMYFQYDQSLAAGGVSSTDIQRFSPKSDQFFALSSYFASAMEHGLLEQMQSSNLVAASTVKMLQLANAKNQTIYLANSGNWTSGANVLGHIVNYDTASLGNLISQGYTLLLATNGAVNLAGSGSWIGTGYVEQLRTSNNETLGMIISGPNYHGGYAEFPTVTPDPVFISTISYDNPVYVNPAPVFTPITLWGDPINMADASFTLNTTDLSLGQAEPLGMTFTRNYTPALRHVNLAQMGNGWTHSYYFNLDAISAPMASLGETTAAQMVPMLVANCAAINLYNPQPDPKNWMTTVLIAKWGIDQTISNAVSITLGKDTLQFIRQPGGIYTPPANCTWTLTNNPNFSLRQRNGNTFIFNSSKQLTSITNQSGAALSLTYSSGNLTKATDWKGRTLTFNYLVIPGGTGRYKMNSMADNSGRTVFYNYTTSADGNLDLTSVIDPEGKTSTFLYDTNHQLVATKDALGRLVVTNIYDVFGHVVTQYTQGDTNKTWHYFWSGWETVSQDPAGNKQRFFYDDQTRLVAQQDPLGNTSQTVFDGQDHAVMTISPLNETNQAIYDGNNNVVQTIDPLGFTNRFVYDNQNNLVYTIDPLGNTNSFGYDSHFRLTGSTNGMGDSVTYTYNTDGTLATRVDPGGTTSYGYDANGLLNKITYPGSLGSEGFLNSTNGDVLSHTNARNFVTSFKYNNRRQLTNSIAPTNMLTQVVYDAIGNVVSATDARGFTTSEAWSVTRHLLSTTLPPTAAGTATITNAYDNRDWLVKTVNPLGQATLYTNDAAQRLIATTDPLLRTTTLGYDADGHNLASTNAAGNVTAEAYDARGSLTMLTDPAGRIVRRAYDGAGNQITLTNRNGKKWQFQFDAANRLTNTITPLSRSYSQVYNNWGLLASSKEPSGQAQTFSYDAKGRLTNRTDSVGTTVYKYDANDNPTNVVENGLTNGWTYDAYDRVSSCKDVFGNLIQYKYDLNGNMTNLVYPGGKNVFYSYDSLNHMTNVTDWSGRKSSISYDLAGQVTSITRPNGTVCIISYDAAGQTASMLEKLANGAIINLFKLGWDNAARMATEYGAPLPHTATQPTRNLMFDDDNRLTSIDGNSVVNDADGNMTSGPLTNDVLLAYTYDARNRLLNVDGVTNAYDPSGNRVGIAYGTNSVAYVINPNSKLSQVLMRIENGMTNYYIYGAGLLYQITEAASRTNTLTYHYDYRGSTVALTDSTGTNVTDRIEYSAYATTTYRTGTNDTPFLYNGRYGVMTDPNGLLNMRARFYNPFICRFVNPDPTGFSGGLNFYAYADGNPVSFLDPFGLSPNWKQVAIGSGKIIGGISTLVLIGITAGPSFGTTAILGSAGSFAAIVNGTVQLGQGIANDPKVDEAVNQYNEIAPGGVGEVPGSIMTAFGSPYGQDVKNIGGLIEGVTSFNSSWAEFLSSLQTGKNQVLNGIQMAQDASGAYSSLQELGLQNNLNPSFNGEQPQQPILNYAGINASLPANQNNQQSGLAPADWLGNINLQYGTSSH